MSVQFGEDAGSGCFDLDCNFICFYVGDGLVQIYPLSFFFGEVGDGSFSDGVGDAGEREDFFWIDGVVQANW